MERSGARRSRLRRAGVLRWALALLLVGVPFTFPAAGAVFTAVSADAGNSVTAGALAPPSGFGAAQTCSLSSITFVGQSQAGSNNSSLTLSVPAATQVGDVVVAQVTNRYDTGYTLTPPAGQGWNLVNRQMSGNGGNIVSSAMYWKVATAAGAGTSTFTLSSPTIDMAGGLAVFRGVDTSTPVNASAFTIGSSVHATAPSVTTTVANTVLVHTSVKRQEMLLQPTGDIALWRIISTGGGTVTQGVSAGYAAFAGPGASPVVTISSAGSGTAEWVTFTVALRPAATVSADLTWTASSSSTATGYSLERLVGGTVQSTTTVTPVSSTGTTVASLVNGTAYTFRLRTYLGTWTSTAVTAALTPSC